MNEQFFGSLALRAGPLCASYLGLHVALSEGGEEGHGCARAFSLVPACTLLHLILRRGRDHVPTLQSGRLRQGDTRRREEEPVDSFPWVSQGPTPGLSMQGYLRNTRRMSQ